MSIRIRLVGAVCALLLIPAGMSFASARVCSLPPTDEPRQGYGADANLFAEETALSRSGILPALGMVLCNDANEGEVLLGDGKETTFIYEYVYRSTPERRYVPVRLSGDKKVGGWIVGEAQSTERDLFAGLDLTDSSRARFVLAYICQYIDGQWKCGCRDRACVTPHWQLFVASPLYGYANQSYDLTVRINHALQHAVHVSRQIGDCRAAGFQEVFGAPGSPMCPASPAHRHLRWPVTAESMLTETYQIEQLTEDEYRTPQLPYRFTSQHTSSICAPGNCTIQLRTLTDPASLSSEEQRDAIMHEVRALRAKAMMCLNIGTKESGRAEIRYEGPGSYICEYGEYTPQWPDTFEAVDWNVRIDRQQSRTQDFRFTVTTIHGSTTCSPQGCTPLR